MTYVPLYASRTRSLLFTPADSANIIPSRRPRGQGFAGVVSDTKERDLTYEIACHMLGAQGHNISQMSQFKGKIHGRKRTARACGKLKLPVHGSSDTCSPATPRDKGVGYQRQTGPIFYACADTQTWTQWIGRRHMSDKTRRLTDRRQ